LNLSNNTLNEPALVALANSRHLGGADIRLVNSGTPWGFSQESRQMLIRRFGHAWYYLQDGGEAEKTDEEF
jgi:hypothetical protein